MRTEGADGFVPLGFKACRDCGGFMLASLSAVRCEGCRDVAEQTVAALELAASNGRLVTRKRSRRKPKPSKATKDRRRAWGQARQAALLRLARIHHDLYEVLLSEEKAARGLDPHIDERQRLSEAG